MYMHIHAKSFSGFGACRSGGGRHTTGSSAQEPDSGDLGLLCFAFEREKGFSPSKYQDFEACVVLLGRGALNPKP